MIADDFKILMEDNLKNLVLEVSLFFTFFFFHFV